MTNLILVFLAIQIGWWSREIRQLLIDLRARAVLDKDIKMATEKQNTFAEPMTAEEAAAQEMRDRIKKLNQ